MIGILAVGFIANLLIRPVASRFWEPAPARCTNRPDPDREGEGLMKSRYGSSSAGRWSASRCSTALWETIAKAKNLF